jgi:FtsP/CotA-like multicopper oxidase with cupredoxin domain
VQVQKGLQAPLLVRGPNEPRSDDERVLVIDDVRLKPDGSLDEYLDDTGKMMGREGNVLLVNGHPAPTFRVRPGATLRLRLVNSANGRFFHLRVPGVTFHVIGTDGGLVPVPFTRDRLLMAPGERYDVLLSLPKTPGAIDVWNDPHERGHDSGSAAPTVLWTLSLEGDPVAEPAPLPTKGPSLARLVGKGPPIDLVLDEGSQHGEMVFTVNGKAHPDVPPIDVRLGETRLLHVKNASDMDHPFHLHGFFFQVVARNGQAEPENALANKDTIIVPMKSDVLLAARFDEAGRWMYHCHILEHAEAGMMGDIDVGATTKPGGVAKPPKHSTTMPGHTHGHPLRASRRTPRRPTCPLKRHRPRRRRRGLHRSIETRIPAR